jgi:branched-chain amino acid transport system substrate-binding protein
MKTKRFFLATIILLVIASIIFNGCKNKQEEIIKIGAILPLTGNQAFFGKSEKNGLLFAIEELNKTGGIKQNYKIELIIEDSKGNPSHAIAAANKLIVSDKVKYIFTSLSGVSNAVSSVTKSKNILQFAFAMDDRITQGNEHVFRTYPGTQELAKGLSQMISSDYSNKLAIIYPQQSGYEAVFQEFLIPSLKQKGIKIELIDAFDMKNITTTFRGLITKIRKKRIDALFLGAYYNNMPEIFKIIEENNLLNTLYIFTEFNLQIAVMLNTIDPKKFSNNVKMVIPAYGLYQEISKSDSIRFKEYFLKHNSYPNYDVAFAYDAIKLLAESIETVGKNPDSIKNYMRNIKDYKGMSGKITIDSNNNWRTQWIVAIYSNGNLITIKEK